jgi:hypothetical protein
MLLGKVEILGNEIEEVVAHIVSVINATELFTLNWAISCYMNFTSINY